MHVVGFTNQYHLTYIQWGSRAVCTGPWYHCGPSRSPQPTTTYCLHTPPLFPPLPFSLQQDGHLHQHNLRKLISEDLCYNGTYMMFSCNNLLHSRIVFYNSSTKCLAYTCRGVGFVLVCIELSNSTSHINLLNITLFRWLICTKLRQYKSPRHNDTETGRREGACNTKHNVQVWQSPNHEHR